MRRYVLCAVIAGSLLFVSRAAQCAGYASAYAAESGAGENSERCFLGQLIARFDATYENALRQRHNRRTNSNRTGAACTTSECPSENYGFVPPYEGRMAALPRSTARFHAPPVPEADLEAGPHPLVSRAERARYAPEPAEMPAATPTRAIPAGLPEAREDAAEPARENAAPLESGAAFVPRMPAWSSAALVERVTYADAPSAPTAAPIATAVESARGTAPASFTSAPAVANAAVFSAAKPIELPAPALEVRFKSELDLPRASASNPLR